MEWHQHVYDEERRGARPSRLSWKAALALGLGMVLFRLLRPVLYDLVGVGWTIGMMVAITTVLLWLAIRGARRDRRAWEATRRDGAIEDSPKLSDGTEALSDRPETQAPPKEARSP